MGVQGLWSILESSSQPVSLSSLKGKVLAVDVSIWLHQAVKGFRDKNGQPLPNAHLLGLFHRICKLLAFGIRPVFVFDGGVPALKKQTLAARRALKIGAASKAKQAQSQLLLNAFKTKISKGGKIKKLQSGPRSKKQGPYVDLSSIVEEVKTKSVSQSEVFSESSDDELDLDSSQEISRQIPTESDYENDYAGFLRLKYNFNYQYHYADDSAMLNSSEFNNLPLRIQLEILQKMEESKKHSTWSQMGDMPKDLDSFSNFQMNRLLMRSALQKKIDSVRKLINEEISTGINTEEIAKFEAVCKKWGEEEKSEKIGDKSTNIELISKDISKNIESNEDRSKNIDSNLPSTSKKVKKYENLEEDDDLELAIQLSFEEQLKKTKKEENSSISNFISSDSNSESDADDILENKKIATEPQIKSQILSPPEIISDDEEADLKKAIQLSLQNDVTYKKISLKNNVEILDDAKSNRSPPRKSSFSSPEKIEKIAAKSPASSQISNYSSTSSQSQALKFSNPSQTSVQNLASKFDVGETELSASCYKFLGWVGFTEKSEKKAQESDNSSESDEDFEEVEPIEGPKNEIIQKLANLKHEKISAPPIQINLENIYKKEKLEEEEDLFADIFKSSEIKNEVKDDAKGEIYDIIESDDEDVVLDDDLKEILESEKNEPSTNGAVNKGQVESLSLNNLSKSEGLALAQESEKSSSGIERTLGKLPLLAKQMLSSDYLQTKEKLEAEKKLLKTVIGNQERIATSISDQMYSEAQDLLSLFGIPYVVSPMEAESQCAFLDSACLTEGTITDDSDIWLFGGLRVYKNFFSQGEKHVELYQIATITKETKMDREMMVLLGMLTGSDYTRGVEGVGPVTGIEILTEFINPSLPRFEALVNFYNWWSSSREEQAQNMNRISEKFTKLNIREGFPNRAVYDAYMNPTVDSSTEPFRWGSPDFSALKKYAWRKFGWDEGKVSSILLPVTKYLNEEKNSASTSKQLTLDRYMLYGVEKNSSGKRGKRFGAAQKKLSKILSSGQKDQEFNLKLSSDEEGEDEKVEEEKPKSKKRKIGPRGSSSDKAKNKRTKK